MFLFMVSGFGSPRRSECSCGSISVWLSEANADAGFGSFDQIKTEALTSSKVAEWTAET
jgi:hypothetical protein